VLTAVALALTAWWVLRASGQAGFDTASAPAPVVRASPLVELSNVPGAAPAPSAAPSSDPVGPEAAAGGALSTAAESRVVVDVAGKVRRPGIRTLPAGARVADALAAAGGARPGVNLSSLNLARVLTDGEQVLVGAPGAAGPATGSAGSGAVGDGSTGSSPAVLVNLNTADQATLESLPGVGPVTATAIVAWRTENGGFTAVDQLLDVSGIGEVTFAEVAPLVTL
jgi:competence protein ComEA